MIRAFNKLKTWAKKKNKKKKGNGVDNPAHLCHCCCSCHGWSNPEPSAPPLPALAPWLHDPKAQGDEINDHLNIRSASYQQYLVPSPLYGSPASHPPTSFGDLVSSFAYCLCGCLCSCFQPKYENLM